MENIFTRPSDRKAAELIAGVKAGGTLLIHTALKTTKIDAKCVAKFEKAGVKLLTDDGDDFRVASGRNSLYVYRSIVWVNF